MSNFPSHWQLMHLEEAMEVIIDYRGKTPKKSEQGVPLITAKVVKNGRIEKPNEYIPEESYEGWMVRGLPAIGDIVVTTEAPLGEVAQLDDANVALAQRIVTLRGKEKVLNNDFLLYLMQSRYIQDQLEARASGSTVRGIKQSELRKILLPVPPESEQLEIANHLKALDKKIELNRQTNQTLEQIAQSIFKSWFVDFDPVRAKIGAREAFIQQHPEVTLDAIRAAAGTEGDTPAHAAAKACELAAMCAISGKSEEQLNELDADTLQQIKATAALFPDELVDSELGEMAEGWVCGTLSDIGSFGEERINVSELSLENYISTENMLEGKKGITVASSLPSVKTVPAFRKGQILVSNIRPYFKKIWLAQFEGGRSNDVLGIESVDQESTEFLYNLVFQDTFFNFMMMTSKGAKMPRGDKDAIMAWKLPIPDLAIRRKYTSTVNGYYVLADSLNNENHFLEQLRDTLLPKLLSGAMCIPEAEKLVETAEF